jgi:hypothetical protein
LNVTAFLASAVAGIPDVLGEPYRDGSANWYLPMARQPILVFGAGPAELAEARRRAAERGLRVAIYTEDMFKTDNDADNRAVVAPVPAEELRLVGIVVYGARNPVDKALRGLSLHP